jgi:hypothetical protein
MNDPYQTSHLQYEYIPFPELGHGSQFHTYDTHDGRVLKLPLTKEETYVVVSKRRHNMNPLSSVETAPLDTRIHTIINGKGRIPAMLNHSFYDSKDFLAILGNPAIINAEQVLPEDKPGKQWGAGRVIYTQDKLTMVGDILTAFGKQPILKPGDIAKIKQIVELYIEQVYKLWSYGFADYVFKIGDTGFDVNGNFVLADIGEYSSDATFMKKALADKRWLHSIISDKIDFPQIPEQLHDYFVSTLNSAFTIEQFMSRWRTKHQCSTCEISDDNVINAFIAAKVAEIDFVDRW